jgi:HPt (histidine-containing phosphotransfer) domain-containing protein
VHDEQERAVASTRRLPPAALLGLREVFAVELAERLPRLRAAVDSGADAALHDARRDAHTLGSSAAVVGEAGAARAARAAEALLADRPAGGPVPAGLPEAVDRLAAALSGWRP